MTILKKIWQFIYKYWMKFAKALGFVQTRILLFIMYYIGLSIISLIMVFTRKDLLNKSGFGLKTFWTDRVSEPPSLENCKRQF